MRSSLVAAATLATAIAATAFATAATATPVTAQQRPFSTDDALAAVSINVLDVSPDGRWIAASTATARDRQNTDHFRFGDPTYTAPRTAAFLLIDAESGDEREILPGRVQVTGVEWSPDGDRLAFLLHGDGVSLHIFDRTRGSVSQVSVDGEIASTSTLEWRPDGVGLPPPAPGRRLGRERPGRVPGAERGAHRGAGRERPLPRLGPGAQPGRTHRPGPRHPGWLHAHPPPRGRLHGVHPERGWRLAERSSASFPSAPSTKGTTVRSGGFFAWTWPRETPCR
jgi:hypothetical protein